MKGHHWLFLAGVFIAGVFLGPYLLRMVPSGKIEAFLKGNKGSSPVGELDASGIAR